jgi:micrococcal nuclease
MRVLCSSLAILVSLYSCRLPPRQGKQQAPEVYVVRVIDGDTIEISSGEKVRLAGIDAPESKNPSKPKECLGEEAGEFLRQAVDKKPVVVVADSQRWDRYHRLLGHVYVGGEYINQKLVLHGLAIVYRARASDQNTVLLDAERAAQAGRVGIWGPACVGRK